MQTLGGSEAARLQYERIQAAHVAATSQHVLPATKVRTRRPAQSRMTLILLSCVRAVPVMPAAQQACLRLVVDRLIWTFPLQLPRQTEEPQSPLLILGHSPGDHQFSIAF